MLKFFAKVVTDSGIKRLFDEYKEDCVADSKAAKAEIYAKYHRFISANTPSHSKTDVDRIFHKVFNLFAYSNMLPGSNGKLLDWYDLMYNRVNWRDKDKKQKSLTRQQASAAEIEQINRDFYIDYQVNKAIRKVRDKQGTVSEVHDDLASGIATEVHHIFPKSEFPELASYFENLILLTSSQHRQKAHPKSNFHLINREYQLICLMAKSRTVEDYILQHGESFYAKKSFVYVVNTGTSSSELDENDSFDVIRRFIHTYYNMTPSAMEVLSTQNNLIANRV
jgi:5-methylcytosine-specific restriction endonuclease McrA